MVNMAGNSPEKTKKQKRNTKKPSAGSSKFYCSTCDVHCPNQTTLEQHNSGKKHVANVANVQRRDQHAMCSVFVGNLPKYSQIRADSVAAPAAGGSASVEDKNEILKSELAKVFGAFGTVSKLIIDKKHGSYCIIEYETPAMARIVLAEYQAGKIPPFHGQKLQIKSRKVTEIKPLHHIITHKEIDRDNILDLLDEGSDDPLCALNMVDAAVTVSDAMRRKHEEACTRIQTQLNDNLPFHDIKLTVYGSAATGLSLKDSDLDVSLSVDREKRIERDDLVRVLKQKCTGVSHVHIIPAPGQGTITRFLDGISNTMFDILFSNRLGLANTRLISTILSHDTRLHKLVRLLIFWSKINLGSRFAKQATPSSYAMTIMIFHFLRQKQILPDFLDTTLITDHTRIYDLDCSFVTDLDKLPTSPTSPSASIPELMAGFWKYYGSEFDRDKHVVSMRGLLSKEELESEMGDTDSQHNYVSSFKPSSIAVQDPFVLTHNITQNVSVECAVALRDACRSAAGNWENGKPLHCWWLGGRVDVNMTETIDEGAEDEEIEEEGSRTPVWKHEHSPTTGNKRSVEAMER